MTRLEQAIARIDEYNKKDPNKTLLNGQEFPKEYLDSVRQSEWLSRLSENPSEELRIAVRSQHIGRWEIPRSSYPETRTGYLNWRSDLAQFHADKTSAILEKVGYDEGSIEKVRNLNLKKGIKLNQEAQTLEDVLCLVFLEFHITGFYIDHERDKMINIIRKTWKKMGDAGREHALRISYHPEVLEIIKEALGETV